MFVNEMMTFDEADELCQSKDAYLTDLIEAVIYEKLFRDILEDILEVSHFMRLCNIFKIDEYPY